MDLIFILLISFILGHGFLVLFTVLCSIMNISFGFEAFYIGILKKMFQFGKNKIQKNGSFPLAHDKAYSSTNDLYNLEYFNPQNNYFHFTDVCEPIKCTIMSIIDDEVTKRFSEEELTTWNLLTRTNNGYHFVSGRLTIIWFLGFLFRYFVLFPWRLCFFSFSFMLALTLIMLAPSMRSPILRKYVENFLLKTMFHSSSIALSIFTRFHNTEYRLNTQGICVANHTTPIDVLILNCDQLYHSVGQIQDGFFGFFQKALVMYGHVFFERSLIKDRRTVVNVLKKHTEDSTCKPILIFPEGTCINNTSVMKFNKGAFEIGCQISPVAIKYNSYFSNPFWNSSAESFGRYIFSLMTSWAVVVDIWYLPPMMIRESENSIDFANRVKHCIAQKAGLVNLDWDGQLKRSKVPESLKSKKQQEFAERINCLRFDNNQDKR